MGTKESVSSTVEKNQSILEIVSIVKALSLFLMDTTSWVGAAQRYLHKKAIRSAVPGLTPLLPALREKTRRARTGLVRVPTRRTIF